MQETNAQSLIFIIFLLIFFLAPTLLKLLGKYTLESKKAKDAPAPALEETYIGENPYSPDRGEERQDSLIEQNSKPIEPRWF
jgi:hypothetical protein